MFSGSMGFGRWLGKLPSGSKYIGTYSNGSPSNIGGSIFPAMPFPASTTIFSGLPRFSASMNERQCLAYSCVMSLRSTEPEVERAR